MGADRYWYFVPYEKDVQHALDELRQREFRAGRYNPVVPFLDFSEPAFSNTHPGPQHESIEAVLRDVAEGGDGTRSILDIERVADEPFYAVAAPFAEEDLLFAFDTTEPSHEMVEREMDELLSEVDRGQCRYLLVYKDGVPDELFFAGASWD